MEIGLPPGVQPMMLQKSPPSSVRPALLAVLTPFSNLKGTGQFMEGGGAMLEMPCDLVLAGVVVMVEEAPL